LLIYGWQQYRWLSLGYEIDKARDKRDALLERQRELVVQEQTYAATGRIEDNAIRLLGMVVPEPGQIVTLGPEDNWTNPSADEAATPLTASTQR
jgi:cell division protein FtsL